MSWSCAVVRFGDEEHPLFGLPKWCTDERCDRCSMTQHLVDTHYNGNRFLCFSCRDRVEKLTEIPVVPGTDGVHNVGR